MWSIFFQILTIDTQELTQEDEIWGTFWMFTVMYVKEISRMSRHIWLIKILVGHFEDRIIHAIYKSEETHMVDDIVSWSYP